MVCSVVGNWVNNRLFTPFGKEVAVVAPDYDRICHLDKWESIKPPHIVSEKLFNTTEGTRSQL
jgi:hypothetical protein